MKVERWEEETDEDWADRLAEEIQIAETTETTQYFWQKDSMAEDSIILNYAGKDAWSYKEHPQGPFTAAMILGWKNDAEQFRKLCKILGVQSSTQTARDELDE